MSYLIQNYYVFNKLINMIPRVKFLLILINNEKFFLFFKINLLWIFLNKNFLNKFTYFFDFFKYLYIYNFNKFFYKINLNLSSNYYNNLKKSIVFWNFKNFYLFLNNKNNMIYQYRIKNLFLYNLYFYSIKVVNFRTNKRYFTGIIFFFMTLTPILWYNHSLFLKYYYNFFLLFFESYFFPFYNGFFFNVYNY
jgi:hypothetical protein